MKKIYRTLLVVLLSAGVFSVKAQDTKKEMDDKYVENDVVSLAGKKNQKRFISLMLFIQ